MSPVASRRQVLTAALAAAPATAFSQVAPPVAPIDEWATAREIAAQKRWGRTDLFDFVSHLPRDEAVWLARSLGNERPHEAGTEELANFVVECIQWRSNNIVAYRFEAEIEVDYDGVVEWLAADRIKDIQAIHKAGVTEQTLKTAGTPALERYLIETQFAEVWDTLSDRQRQDALAALDAEAASSVSALGLAGLTGAAAVIALKGAVSLAGFAFYTMMSSLMCAAAGVLGMTLPFAAYMGASSAVAFATGPFGWAVLGAILVAVTAGTFGLADRRKTTAAVLAIHVARQKALSTVPPTLALSSNETRRAMGTWMAAGASMLVLVTVTAVLLRSRRPSATTGPKAPAG